MNINKIDYRALAVRSIKDPTLALYACCPHCGGDIGVHKSTALFLDSVFHTGVKFCEHQGKACTNEIDSHEWVWSRIDRLNGYVDEDFADDLEDDEPVYFEIAV